VPRLTILVLGCLLAACATSGSRAKQEEEGTAVLLILSPPEESGKTLIGRIRNDELGVDLRPSLDTGAVELKPGRYRLETYFWIARSRLDRGAKGQETLVIENLQSAEIAPMEIVVQGGRTYFIRADLRRKGSVPPGERSAFHPLNQGESISDPDRLRMGIARVLAESDFVWRPELTVLPDDRAGQYRKKR